MGDCDSYAGLVVEFVPLPVCLRGRSGCLQAAALLYAVAHAAAMARARPTARQGRICCYGVIDMAVSVGPALGHVFAYIRGFCHTRTTNQSCLIK